MTRLTTLKSPDLELHLQASVAIGCKLSRDCDLGVSEFIPKSHNRGDLQRSGLRVWCLSLASLEVSCRRLSRHVCRGASAELWNQEFGSILIHVLLQHLHCTLHCRAEIGFEIVAVVLHQDSATGGFGRRKIQLVWIVSSMKVRPRVAWRRILLLGWYAT